MPVIRRKLDPNEVYSETTRYDQDTDTVQSLVNGSWVDNPTADPRTQTLFPPISTSDPACDGAQRASDAFEGQITEIINLINESNTFFTIAGAILALFEFGPFGLFIALAIALAHAMLDIGATALTAAFPGDVWDKFKCILFCHMGSDGRVKPGELSAIQSDVSVQIGGIAATILNAMLSLAGEGGVNNLAALGTATGDCSGCDCSVCAFEGWVEVTGSPYTLEDNGSWTIPATTGHGDAKYYAGLYAPTDSDDCHTLSITVVSGGGLSDKSYSTCGEIFVAQHNDAFPLSGLDRCFRTIFWSSEVAFTLNVRCTGDCEPPP